MNKNDLVTLYTNPQPIPSTFNEGFSQYETIRYMIGLLNQLITNQNLGADEIAELENKKVSLEFYLNDLANNRKLSLFGDFTGSWWGIEKPVHVEGGIDGVVIDIQNKIGNNVDLTTNDKTTIVKAINENNKSIKNIYISVKEFGAKGDGVADDTISIQNAIDYCMTNGGGVVYLPNGTYMVSKIQLRQYVSFIGSGGRTCTLKKIIASTGNIVEFKQENTSYIFNTYYGGFTIEGTGIDYNNKTVVDGTNNGLVLNHYWGLDGCHFKDILIKNCGGFGLMVIPSPDNEQSSELMVLQQSLFDNLTIEYCYNGVLTKGFVGNIQWNTITIDHCINRGFETRLGTYNNGSQDNVFINSAFQFCDIGFYCDSSFINFNFLGGCHFEGNWTKDIYLKNVSGAVNFDGIHLANSPINFHFDTFSGTCNIDNITLKGNSTLTATGNHIKVTNSTGLIYVGFNLKVTNIYTNFIDDVGVRIRNNRDWNFTPYYENLRTKAISSTGTRGKNLCGLTNAVNGASYQDVTFTTAEPDTDYRTAITPSFNTTVYITNKTVNGFRVYFGTPVPTTGNWIEWIIVR